MICIKTGFHAYLVPYGEWVYGDAFKYETVEVHLFRICGRGREPWRPYTHFVIYNFDQWFDRDKTSMQHNSTMIALGTLVRNLGYDGIPNSEVEKL